MEKAAFYCRTALVSYIEAKVFARQHRDDTHTVTDRDTKTRQEKANTTGSTSTRHRAWAERLNQPTSRRCRLSHSPINAAQQRPNPPAWSACTYRYTCERACVPMRPLSRDGRHAASGAQRDRTPQPPSHGLPLLLNTSRCTPMHNRCATTSEQQQQHQHAVSMMMECREHDAGDLRQLRHVPWSVAGS